MPSYQRIRRLGVGGTGELFLARGTDERLAVLKIVGAERAEASRTVEVARLLAQVKHPHVAQILEVFEEAGEPIVAMEYVDGESLAVLLRAARQRAEALPHLVRIVAQAARGLQAAHEARDASGRPLGIVHGEVNPQNVMVTREGVTKLVGFAGGSRAGKLAYLAPEQSSDHPADVSTDLFSLGLVLWEVCLGRRARVADDDAGLARQVKEGPVPAPSSVQPGFDVALGTIISRAVAVDRAARFSSGEALAQELERWLASRASDGQTLASWVMAAIGSHLDARRLSVEQAGRPSSAESSGAPSRAPMPEAAEGSLIESILRDVPLTAELVADLARLGVEPARLKTKYRVDVWARTIDIVRRHKYPELPSDESSRQLGWDFAKGFAQTIGGRLVMAVLPLLETESLLAKVPRFFKLGRPDIAISWHRSAPGVGFLNIVDAAQVSPYFDVGLIQYMLERIGAAPQWRVEWKSLTEFAIHYQWPVK